MTVTDLHTSKSSPDLQRAADEELDLFGLTDRGKVRPDNEDQFLICTVHPQVVVHGTSLRDIDTLPLRGTRLATCLVVADGVGGRDSGGEAARLAAESITRYVASTLRSYHVAGSSGDDELFEALRKSALQAHDAVRAEAASRADPRPMATTLTVALAVWPWLYALQVGDSRCYYLDGSTLRQMTRDQTLAQQLVDQGVLPKERIKASPFRNVLASAVGGEEALPEVTRAAMRRPGTTLLCSDGLTKHVTDEEIAEHLRTMTSSEQVCRALVDLALERGGTDNVTVVVGRAPLAAR